MKENKSMSAFERNCTQQRDLRTAPDRDEPSFTDEEDFVNNQPVFIKHEDEIYERLDRSNHRSCSSYSGQQHRSKNVSSRYIRKSDPTSNSDECNNERIHKHIRRNASANNLSMDTSATSSKEKRRQQGRNRAKERSDKFQSLTSGCDRGKIEDTTTVDIHAETSCDSNEDVVHDSLSSLYIETSSTPQQIVSVTPDRFEIMQHMNRRDDAIENLSNTSWHIGRLHSSVLHGIESLIESLTLSGSDNTRRPNYVSVCNSKINRVDLNPNEKTADLLLHDMNLSCSAIPTYALCGSTLGGSLQKLSFSCNPLREIPPDLVVSLPALQMLDLSQCQLHHLPKKFNLPKLRIFNLRDNALTDFPTEDIFKGLPELIELIVYGNRLTEISLPIDSILSTMLLVKLDVGCNFISDLPIELDQLKELRHLNVSNNWLTVIPMRICEMDIHDLDVSQNQIDEPPIHICELGTSEMRQYWQDVRTAERTKNTKIDIVCCNKSPRKGKRCLMRSLITSPSLSRTTTGTSDLSESTRQSSIISLHSLSNLTSDDRPTDEALGDA